MLLKPLVALVLVLSLPSIGSSADVNDPDAKDRDALQGTWLPSAAELAGKKYPDEIRKSVKLVIKDDKYVVTVGTEGPDEGTVKLNAAVKPKEMDITGTDGPNKGKTFLCIYELNRDQTKGDTLRICYDLSGKSRPKEFKTQAGTKLYLVTYKRQNP